MKFIARQNEYDMDMVEVYSIDLMPVRRCLVCAIHYDYFPGDIQKRLDSGEEITLNVTIEEGK